MEEGRNVAIVDETFVRLVLGGKNPIGQLLREPRSERNDKPGPWLEIVGVVKDMTIATDKTTADAMLYRPSAPGGHIFVHSRAATPRPDSEPPGARPMPRLRLSGVTTIDRQQEKEAQMAGFGIKALGTIAAMTLMLAAAGIHSLISFTLASRTREIGIRTALGAAPLRIVRGILSPAFMKVGIGIVLGSIPGAALIHATLAWGIDSRMTVSATAWRRPLHHRRRDDFVHLARPPCAKDSADRSRCERPSPHSFMAHPSSWAEPFGLAHRSARRLDWCSPRGSLPGPQANPTPAGSEHLQPLVRPEAYHCGGAR